MDFALWGAKSDARYPCGQGRTQCQRGGGTDGPRMAGPTSFYLVRRGDMASKVVPYQVTAENGKKAVTSVGE